MELFPEYIGAAFIAILGPVLTLFDLPGNTLMVCGALFFSFFGAEKFFDASILVSMFIVYILGELWEFIVSYFGIKKEKISWGAVLVIGVGGLVGTALGTAVFPVLGSFIGGLAGAFGAAFLYEYRRSGSRKHAVSLALKAAKFRFLALLGKLAAAIVLSALLIRLVLFA